MFIHCSIAYLSNNNRKQWLLNSAWNGWRMEELTISLWNEAKKTLHTNKRICVRKEEKTSRTLTAEIEWIQEFKFTDLSFYRHVSYLNHFYLQQVLLLYPAQWMLRRIHICIRLFTTDEKNDYFFFSFGNSHWIDSQAQNKLQCIVSIENLFYSKCIELEPMPLSNYATMQQPWLAAEWRQERKSINLHESTSWNNCNRIVNGIVYAWCIGTNETFFSFWHRHIKWDWWWRNKDEIKTKHTQRNHYVLVNPSVSKHEATMKLHMQLSQVDNTQCSKYLLVEELQHKKLNQLNASNMLWSSCDYQMIACASSTIVNNLWHKLKLCIQWLN